MPSPFSPLAKDAEEIQGLGRELYERLTTLVDHREGVGRNIYQAAESYNRFVGSLESKVLPAARKFKDLGVSSAKDIEQIDLLDVQVRRVSHEERLAPDEPLLKRPFRAPRALGTAGQGEVWAGPPATASRP
jgi:DNA recombination protein RmuC